MQRITNGIALCKLHHAAFDRFIIGVSPEYTVHVRRDVLEETDGPILRYGLQKLEGSRLYLPQSNKNWPNRQALGWRFERFKAAARAKLQILISPTEMVSRHSGKAV